MITLSAYLFIVGVVMLALLIGLVAFQRVRAVGLKVLRINNPSAMPAGAAPAGDAEHQASAAAEALQAIVHRRMAADPAFAGQSLDFGTAPGGSVEVWLNGQAYAGVDQVPDARLRDLIAQAADEFNRGEGAQH